MSTTDAFVRVMCDDCNSEDEASLPFVYAGTMHTDGRYDHKKPRLPEGWEKLGDNLHRCPDCVENAKAA